jgi:hypothetical protein
MENSYWIQFIDDMNQHIINEENKEKTFKKL